ncbi:MAG TPA: O-antigen ligase family protein [Nitrospiria bacterium]|nr:O-antigen ligase family protein [Nitrospiria bacterium]
MRTIERIEPQPLPLLFLSALALAAAFAIVQMTLAHAAMAFSLAGLCVIALLSTPLALYLLIFSMLFSPELVIGQMAGHGIAGRGVTLRLDDILLIVIGFSWLVKMAVYKELGLVLRTPLNRPILFYISACVVATLIGIASGRVRPESGLFYTLKYFEYFFIYFMVVNNLQTQDQVRRYLIALIITCGIVSLYAITQIPGGVRASAPFEGESGEPNTLGGYLVLMFSLVAGLGLHVRGAKIRIALGVLAVVILIALSATLSRTSYLALGGSVLALMLFSRRRLVLVLGLVLMMTLSPFIVPERVKHRVGETFVTQPDEEEQEVQVGRIVLDTSTSARLISWKTSTEDWLRHPIFGYGVTGYGFIDAQYFKVLVDTGLVGITAFLVLLFSLWSRLRNASRSMTTPWTQGLVLGFMAGYIGLLVHGIGANTFIIVRIMEPFWMIVGLLIVLVQNQGVMTQTQPMISGRKGVTWKY